MAQTSEWKPRAGDRIHGSRRALVMALVATVWGLFVLLDPVGSWMPLWRSSGTCRYAAFTYTDTFRHRQGPAARAPVALSPLFIA